MNLMRKINILRRFLFYCAAPPFLIPHSSFLIPDFPHRFPIIHSGGFSMESKLVLYDNYKKANGSFTWYLEDREVFNTFAFKNLCESIRRLSETAPGNREVLLQIHGVWCSIVKCLVYRTNNDKLSMIASLPPDKNFLDDLDRAVSTYLMTCGE
jgi:hypothetical protein